MQKDYPLQSLNTLQIDCTAKLLTEISNTYQLLKLLETSERRENKHHILGGGSNTLFLNNYYDGLIVKIDIKGIEIKAEDENNILLQVGAGEDRDTLIQYSIEHQLGGIENLISIPGKVGTSAVSNIGAYGQEAQESINAVLGVNTETKTIQKLSKEECNFSYRNSIFKQELKNSFIITHVIFKLKKITTNYEFNTSYKDIITYFETNNIDFKNIPLHEKLKTITSSIEQIRKNKLPDHTKIGTAGSFFKNPEISLPEWDNLQTRFPELKAHLTENETMKLSAGQLIELCGWKGKEVNKVKMYEKHALILINEGTSGKNVSHYAQMVQESVQTKFGINLEPEVIYVE